MGQLAPLVAEIKVPFILPIDNVMTHSWIAALTLVDMKLSPDQSSVQKKQLCENILASSKKFIRNKLVYIKMIPKVHLGKKSNH